jgi:crotonobetainyl-CoA:carnitine CoA-transferase CaiB-like acyl-CoA transferase
VLEICRGIAGSYSGKLFSDAGADVVKVEPLAGDPLRRWSASHRDLGTDDGVLFCYLNSGKRSVLEDHLSALLSHADIAIVDQFTPAADIDRWSSSYRRLTVVSITPFGRSGPWAGRPSTEFTLQALCGSMGARGEPDREPLQAGGLLGEYVAGAVGAFAALAGFTGARCTGTGQLVDLSILECMCITMGGVGALQASLGRPLLTPARFVEMPSIEVASDGYVGFCTVTKQQFYDFAVMIGHPEYMEDEELSTYTGRQRRREEFQGAIREWTEKRDVKEIIELAALFRIPTTPVGTPETVSSFDHFVERGVFRHGSGVTHLEPRRPFLINGEGADAPRPVPRVGADNDTVEWGPRPVLTASSESSQKPLSTLKVVDLTAFWAGPTATHLLGALGAEVIKVESVQHPDGMRFSSSRPSSYPDWWEYGAHYQTSNTNKLGITLNLGSKEGRSLLVALIRRCDVVIENFSPRVLDNFGLTWDVVRAEAPRAAMVRMPAFGLDGPWRDRTGFAQTMEQVTGLAWMTGYRGDVPIIPKGVCDPNAGIHAAFAVLAALIQRDASGEGVLVECPMVETALNIGAEPLLEYSAYGSVLTRDGNRGPSAAPQGVYACRGTDRWVALAVTSEQEWDALRGVLGNPPWSRSAELDTADGRRRHADVIDDSLAKWAVGMDVDDAVCLLIAAGVPAARVVEPQDVLDNPQLEFRRFAEWIDHPVTKRHRIMGMPFRFAGQRGGWITRPAPTLGQHNDSVLRDLLGLSATEVEDLRTAGVIGERPVEA